MKQDNLYENSEANQSEFPVRVLFGNCVCWFKNITSNFTDEIGYEVDSNGFNDGIIYHREKSHITDVACLNTSKQIELYENFSQYLWCICYSLLVLFDEGIKKPILEGRFNGKFDLKNTFVMKAIDVFNAGSSLLNSYQESQLFLNLPNPETYNKDDKCYIEKTNGIYTAAMTFILLHEFAHQYFGHTYESTREKSIEDEFSADEYAIDKFSSNSFSKEWDTLKCGIIAGISSLILLNKSLSGGDSHPDTDKRLKNAIEKMNLQEADDNLWGIASLTFWLWANQYNIEIKLPGAVDTFKQLYELIIQQLPH
jgi:hypothetical protein